MFSCLKYRLVDNWGNYGAYGWGLKKYGGSDLLADGSRYLWFVLWIGPLKFMFERTEVRNA